MKKISSVALKVIAELPKPKKQYALSKRESQIVNLAEELGKVPFDKSKDLSFMSRLLVMVNLPYKNPGEETSSWWKQNGQAVLDITPGRYEGKSLGIPYGSYPRLILAYLITQAVKTKCPAINLGRSFKDFLGLIGIEKGGHQYRQLQKQLKRTLTAAFSWTYSNEKMWSRTNIQVSHQSQLWWDPKSPGQLSLWESYIKLNTDFFNEIVRNPVPIDLRVLKVFKNSPLGLDLYMFLSWRTFSLKEPTFISWDSLHNQLGGQYKSLKVFARDCRQHIKRIKAIWPESNLKSVRGRLYIGSPSKTLIPPVEKA
jgi:hypothetical protein